MDNQTQGQQQPTSTDTPSQSTNSNQWLRTLGIGFGIVSFGIAIGVIGYILGTKNSQTIVQNQQNSVVPTVIPSPNPDETANWKTYKSSKGEFMIKYPDGWSLVGSGLQSKQSTQILSDWLETRDNQESVDPQCKNCFKVYSQKETLVNEYTSIVQEVSSHPTGRNMRAYILINDTTIATIYSFPVGENDPAKSFSEEKLNEFDQILATFQFTSP